MPSLPEAVEQKYGEELYDRPIMAVGCFALNLKGCGLYRPPSVLILAGCDIEEAGDESQLSRQCEGVTELDLSSNKFKCWEEIFKILQFVPGLRFLNLSFNKFGNFLSKPSYGSLGCLVQLVLNGTELQWKEVYSMLDLTPGIEELHLCLNKYAKVERSKCQYKNVKRIHFNSNLIEDWQQVENLGQQFPSLEVLILADCPLRNLEPSGKYDVVFPNLKYISLNNTNLSSWESIDCIGKIPQVAELRLYHCPLFEDYPQESRRKFTIARLGSLQRLNGGANISTEEREDAERAFIRHYLHAESVPKRYFELVDIHGLLDPLVDISLKPPKSVDVTVKSGDHVFKRRFSVYTKVQQVKKSLEQQVNMQYSHMRLFFVAKAADGVAFSPEEIKINSKQLYTLNVSDGDEFIIEKKLV